MLLAAIVQDVVCLKRQTHKKRINQKTAFSLSHRCEDSEHIFHTLASKE